MNEETLFQEALSRSPSDRAAFLEQACAGRPELRASVEALLAAHDKSSNILDQARGLATGEFTPQPEDGQPHTGDYHPTVVPGLVIAGRYTLVERIGEGGMGEVWVAKQSEPVKRKVAIKLIKTGMDSKAVLARFEQERQALALMDHPNIARVLDGGMTPTGQPFFVMDLVNGLSLTKFCDEAKLTLRQRLELFVPICQAVQHAHQKGIVHRDLKPANILVTMIDAKPVPKVIDFGVAKATSGRLTDESLSTHFGAVVGTLEYMSPEQAGYSGDDVDTRADIYSLGVLLYELLTGLRPLDAKRLKNAALTEMIRIIKEEEPSKPSTRLSTDESLASSAALRHIEPKKLMALLRGDLDWITMKALEKDRTRRYETANGLARDIQRYLSDEPVEACPPSATYRLRKFAKKNRAALTTAATIAFLLVAGAGVSIWQAVRANRAASAERLAKLDAEEKAAAEKTARQEEQRQRKFAEAITQFVEYEFLALTSVEGQGRFGGEGLDRNATLMDLLNRAADKLKARKDLDPQIEAELCWIIGVNYRAAGEAEKAIGFLERAVQLRSELLGRDHADTAMALNSLAVAYLTARKPDLAIPLLEESIKFEKARVGPEQLDILVSMSNLGTAYRQVGRIDLALPLLEETFKLTKAKHGPEHPNTHLCMNNLGDAYKHAGKLDLALPLFEETLKLKKAKGGPDHPSTLISLTNLALAYEKAGKHDLAVPLHEEALKHRKVKLGPEHPETLQSMNNLAFAYHAAGKLDLAVPLFEETIKLKKAKLGPEHPLTLRCMQGLAEAYKAAGKLDLSLPLYEETLKLSKAKLGPEHLDTLMCMNNLAVAYQAAGKVDLALPLLEETLKLTKAKLGPDHRNTLNLMGNLAAEYWAAKQLDKSIPLFEETLKLQEAKLGRDDPATQLTVANLGVNYKDAGRLKEAIPLLEEAHMAAKKYPAIRLVTNNLLEAYVKAGENAKLATLVQEQLTEARQAIPKDSSQLASQLAAFGLSLLQSKSFTIAEPLLRECLTIREKNEPDDWKTFNTKSLLGGALLGQKKYADAEPSLLAGYEGMKQREKSIPPQGSTRIPEALERLVQLYEALDKKDEAAKWQKELDAFKAAQKSQPKP